MRKRWAKVEEILLCPYPPSHPLDVGIRIGFNLFSQSAQSAHKTCERHRNIGTAGGGFQEVASERDEFVLVNLALRLTVEVKIE